MNDVKVFNNIVFGSVRAIKIEDKVWFVGKDIAEALGYTNTKKAISDHCKEDGVTICSLTDSLGRQQEAKYINQRNVIRLIMRSKLPQAEAFQDWVEDEIIPSVLQTGSYVIKQDSYMIADPIERAKRWIEEQEEAKQLIEQKQAVIDEQQPLVDYAISMDNATDSDKTIKQFARHTTLGPLKLFEFFREHKIFITGGLYHNQPYQVYIDRGYFKVVTKVNQKPNGDSYTYEQTYITPKGETAVFKKYPHLKRTK